MWLIRVEFLVRCKKRKLEDSETPVKEKKIYAGDER